MINYKKIKTGKNLTKNQKRLFEIYKKSCLYSFNNENYTRENYIAKFEEKQKHRKLVDRCNYITNIKSSCKIDYINFYLCNDIKYYKIDYTENFNNNYDKNKYDRYIYKTTTINIYIGRKNIKKYLSKKIGIIDNYLTLHNGKNFILVNVDINNYKKEKIKIVEKKTYISKKKIGKNIYYSHGTTKEDSRRDLLYKIQPILQEKRRIEREKKLFKKINFNTMIGIKLYRLLTGACQMGCEEFAKKHNFDFSLKLKISDLLKYLDFNDYGYSKLFKIVILPLLPKKFQIKNI